MRVKTKNSRVVRDLIRIGVFTALMLAVSCLLAFTIGFFPVLMLTLMPCIMSIASAIIFMVMVSKLTIGGGFFITSTVMGLCMITMAPYGFMFFACVITGILAESAYKILVRGTFRAKLVAICIYSLGGSIGEYGPFVWMRDAYLNLYANNPSGTMYVVEFGVAHITVLAMIILSVCNMGFAVLGCFWGNKIVEKNFKKATAKNVQTK